MTALAPDPQPVPGLGDPAAARSADAASRRTLDPAERHRSERTAALLAQAHRPGATEVERATCWDAVVELNMRVAENIARRFARRGIPVEDLTQVAYLALVRAVRSFDPSHERDLLAYAVPSITGEIRRHFRDHSWTIRPPRDVQRAHGRLVRSGALPDRLDDSAVSILAAEVEESVDVVREALAARACFSPVSLDSPVTGQQDGREIGVVEVPGEDDGARVEARLLVRPLLAGLTPRDRELLHLRFTEELSQREIALRLGMTQIQVSRCLQRLLLQLRGALSEAC